MSITEKWIGPELSTAVEELYDVQHAPGEFAYQKTRKEFEGDITVVTFPLTRQAKKKPEQIGEEIGNYLLENSSIVSGYNVVKGFLNISISNSKWSDFFTERSADSRFGFQAKRENEPSAMVEYSSPNTNKPLHLGHIRNCLLGYSVSELLKAVGRDVKKVQIINDRGIHICKSMVAWQTYANGETPESTGLKGDKLVGNYYVKFDQVHREQMAEMIANGTPEEEAAKSTPILKEAQDMLRKWEAGDEDVMALWNRMNGWVYDGFDVTYKAMGVDFDKNYYESNTYLLGKEIVADGLEKGVFYRRDDNSIWCDLSEDGLDEKLVMRGDGTAVYITQDIGTAVQRFQEFDLNQLIYTVGNEQDYHFTVLFKILKKLGYDWADECYHLSYGMVDLPSGKMKSREGTVVDADDLMSQMIQTATDISEELGKTEGMSETEKAELNRKIGLGALKYYILKVDPKKRMMFNPEESIDFNGNTGPFIQYAYARIQSIRRKAAEMNLAEMEAVDFTETEKALLVMLSEFPSVVQQAADDMSPALVANYVYDLVKTYNSFYQSEPIFNAEEEGKIAFRVQLSTFVGNVIKNGMSVLGIEVPERM
jgi:arginyl-tRNA synthetase